MFMISLNEHNYIQTGYLEVRAGWARTDLYTDITMTNFGKNPVQATKTNKQFLQLKLWDYSDGGDFI